MAEQIKVLALTKYDRQAASSRHRIFNYIPLLAERGIKVTPSPLLSQTYVRRRLSTESVDFLDLARSFTRRIVALCQCRRFDVLWIEGELFPRLPALAERLLKSIRQPYIVDHDAIFHTYDQHPSPIVRWLLGHKVDAVLRKAEAVIAGNDYLAERAVNAGARQVSVIPTTVDDRAYARVQPFHEDKLTLGWIGSSATEIYLQTVKNELEQLCRSLPAQLRLVGVDQKLFNGSDVVVRPWQEETEIQELARFDIGIYPLFDGPWERGKCGFKAIQYMAAGLPVLAANVGALPQIVVHEQTGFLYRSGTEFVSFAQRLAKDPKLRMQFGVAGRRRVATQYSVHLWVAHIKNLLERAAGQPQ